MRKYMNQEQYFDLLKEVFMRQFFDERDRMWHVEDLASSVSLVVDIVTHTISVIGDHENLSPKVV